MYWLSQNSGSLQAAGVLVSAILTSLTIYVLFITLSAVKRQAFASEAQAEAARSQAEVAQAQTKAVVEQAASAQRQSDLLAAQIEQGLAPLLVAEPDDRPNMQNYKVVNHGPGPAFQVFYWQGGLESMTQEGCQIHSVLPSTLGTGSFAYLPIPPGWVTFTVRYKGLDRQERWTVVYADPSQPQEHIVERGLQQVYLT
jgi:hypothetical protein